MRTPLLVCVLIAAFAGLSQASAAANSPSTSPKTSTSQKKSPPRGLSDGAIEQTIRAKLAKSKIGADHFTVKVQSGVAFWEGKTDVIQHKGAATRMARTAGAVAVVNNIQISDAARQRAAHSLTGAVPRATVKHGDGAK
jgi:osmotically-inducible protein OsmY